MKFAFEESVILLNLLDLPQFIDLINSHAVLQKRVETIFAECDKETLLDNLTSLHELATFALLKEQLEPLLLIRMKTTSGPLVTTYFEIVPKPPTSWSKLLKADSTSDFNSLIRHHLSTLGAQASTLPERYASHITTLIELY
jgi:hypothetical protein